MNTPRPLISQDKIFSLDQDTLFLFKVRAIEDISTLQTNRKFTSLEDLKSYTDTISTKHNFFKYLQEEIGVSNNGTCRRSPIKIKNVWDIVKNKLSSFPTSRIMKCDIEYLSNVFGFATSDDFNHAIFSTASKYLETGMIEKETQDKIAEAMGYKDWFHLKNTSDDKYLISVSVLKRAFGHVTCNSAIKEQSLNIITQYICNMNWLEYNTNEGRKNAFDSIIKRMVKPKMNTVIGQLYGQNKVKNTSIPEIKEGDILTVTHADGSTDIYEYVGGEYHKRSKNTEMCA